MGCCSMYEVPGEAPSEEKSLPTDGIDSDFVRSCLANNERGDGLLYAALHRDRFMYNKALGAWMQFIGHFWSLDFFDRSMTGVEKCALRYLEEDKALQPALETARVEERTARGLVKLAEKVLKSAQAKADPGDLVSAKEELAAAEQEHLVKQADLKALDAEHKAYVRRIERLRSVKGAQNALKWAHCVESSLMCKGDEFDRHPMLLACANGVIDLRKATRRDGRPGDMLQRAIPIAWPSDYQHIDAFMAEDPEAPSPCPIWERTFSQVLQDDKLETEFLERYLGYCITGLTNEQYYLFCVGEGANGKGLIFDVLAEILGDLSWDVSPEILMEQKNTGSVGGPSAHLVSLMGRRVIIASEGEENRRISGSMLKRMTGQERINARSPHDKFEVTFATAFKLIFRTNEIPYGITKGFSMIRRLLYLTFPLMYVDDPEAEARLKPQLAGLFRQKVGDLREQLQKEYPGILLWLVRACLKYQRDGLNPPDSIRAAVEGLRREEDHVGRFVEEVCERTEPDQWMMFKEFYGGLEKWYADNIDKKDKYLPSKKSVSAQLVKMGFTREQSGGQTYIYGLRIPVLAQTPG
jgi:putative DNA primase/helicase